ncbi:DUF2442 domain-containing protein [Limnohabitans sp. DM1]|uniref:DUF2442 domain-containing protein n=1 Tax=Limnohabitans sp. DM1 TaxID=1597955 RepID=UPI000B0BBDB5|nr:DUF2442 domain-containing protein [Limnohabitans sp. DM1]
MQDLLDVILVKPMQGYWLALSFENGENRLFDVKPLLTKKPFEPLQQWHVFEQVYVFAGTVNWPGNIDIAPETLYERSVAA